MDGDFYSGSPNIIITVVDNNSFQGYSLMHNQNSKPTVVVYHKNLTTNSPFQYIHPSDAHKLGQAELVVIDEAAAIPLPLVKDLMGPYLVFLSSTVNG